MPYERMRVLMLSLLVSLTCFTPLSAQQVQRDTVLSVLSKAQSGNWFVRVTDANATITGRVLTLKDVTRVGETVIDPAEVTRIERRVRRGGGRMYGAAVGAVIFGLLSYGLAGIDDYPNDGGALVFGGLLGALPGALIGAAVKPGAEDWYPVYAR
jgi:hypothetical protein